MFCKCRKYFRKGDYFSLLTNDVVLSLVLRLLEYRQQSSVLLGIAYPSDKSTLSLDLKQLQIWPETAMRSDNEILRKLNVLKTC